MLRYAPKNEALDKEKKITFLSKELIHCPVCDGTFHREELFSGRVSAGALTDELHREYVPLHAIGEVHPLVYETTVCPSCYYAAFKADFAGISPKIKAPLSESISERVESVQRVFPKIDFQGARRLQEGAASYYLAMMCYERFTKEYGPTIKQGICALRAAWLCSYLDKKIRGANYDYVARLFYAKARLLYRAAIEYEQKGKEQMTTVKWLGPDTDKNYGYEGVLYLAGVLEFKFGSTKDEARRMEIIEESKRTIAKMFGLGRKSRAKPGPLLDKARDLYDKMKLYLKDDSDDD